MPSFQGCNFRKEYQDGSYIDYDIVVRVIRVSNEGNAELHVKCLSKTYDAETQETANYETSADISTSGEGGGE